MVVCVLCRGGEIDENYQMIRVDVHLLSFLLQNNNQIKNQNDIKTKSHRKDIAKINQPLPTNRGNDMALIKIELKPISDKFVFC